MTFPLFYLDTLPPLTEGSDYFLGGAEGYHAAVVLRIAPGEQILLSDGCGGIARCQTLERRTERATTGLRVRMLDRGEERAAFPRVVLVQALSKGARDEWAIAAAVELGVDAVVPWQSDRAVVRWRGERREKAEERWRKTLKAAAQQSRRSRIPQLLACTESSALLEALQTSGRYALVLHEQAVRAMPEVASEVRDLHDVQELWVLVGPEGGMSDRETAGFAGLERSAMVRLGPHILRASTAGPVGLALLLQLSGHWELEQERFWERGQER